MHGNGKSNGKRTVGVGVSPSSRTGKWGDAEKERGLVAVALCSPNTWRAAREIAAQGLPIPRSTLELWVRKNPKLYRRVRDEKLDEIKATLAAQHEALARRQLEAQTSSPSASIRKATSSRSATCRRLSATSTLARASILSERPSPPWGPQDHGRGRLRADHEQPQEVRPGRGE